MRLTRRLLGIAVVWNGTRWKVVSSPNVGPGSNSLEAVVEQRTIRLPQPVKGDPSLTVLRVLGVAQDETPVGAAAHGGNVVAIGSPKEIRDNPDSLTGAFLRAERKRREAGIEKKKPAAPKVRRVRAPQVVRRSPVLLRAPAEVRACWRRAHNVSSPAVPPAPSTITR